jgi:hypothetical protein
LLLLLLDIWMGGFHRVAARVLLAPARQAIKTFGAAGGQ